MAKKPKLAHKSQERLALQHELLAFSGCAGLRLFAAFVKLDQAYPPLKSRAPRTQNSSRTIGWSEVSSLKVMISSGDRRRMRSRTRRSGSPPFTMWTSCSSLLRLTNLVVAEVRGCPHSPIFGAWCLTRKIRCQMRSQLNSRTGTKHPFHITNHWLSLRVCRETSCEAQTLRISILS